MNTGDYSGIFTDFLGDIVEDVNSKNNFNKNTVIELTQMAQKLRKKVQKAMSCSGKKVPEFVDKAIDMLDGFVKDFETGGSDNPEDVAAKQEKFRKIFLPDMA